MNQKKLLYGLVISLVAMAMLLSACATPTTPAPVATEAAAEQPAEQPLASGATAEWPIAQGVKICWITQLGHPYGVAKTEIAKKEAKLFGYTLDVYDMKDIPQEIAAIEDCIAKKYDVIALTPYDKTALNSTMKKARDAGVFVIAEGSDLDDEGKAIVNTLLGSNGVYEGQAAGQLICKALGATGGNWVMIEGATGHPLVPQRGGEAEKWVQENCPNAKMLAKETGEWDSAKSRTVMENFLTAYPGQINLVYCHDGNMCFGADEAIAEAGLTGKLMVIGINGNKDEYARIKDGRWFGTVLNDASWISINLVQRARDLMENRPILHEYISPASIITKENVDSFTPWW
jgi:ABC-type sugar transport system substrate-binding protein